LRQLEPIVRRSAPTLLEADGVGIHTAAILLVGVGDTSPGCEAKPRSRISAASHRFPHRQARRNDTG
jgi:hypothetical protein